MACLVAVWGWMTLLLSPWWISSLAEIGGNHPSVPIRFWVWMTFACALEVPGNYLLLRSLQRTDLSVFGPLSSYKPIVGMLLAWLLLAEVPNSLGLIGMLIVLGGSYLLADPNTVQSNGNVYPQSNFWHQGVRDRLLGVALTAAGAVVMKISMLASDSVTSLAVWSAAGWAIALVFLAGLKTTQSLRQKAQIQNTPIANARNRFIRLAFAPNMVWIALAMMAMQGCTIIILKQIPVGYALALFQLGSLLSVYVGHRWFGERQIWKRLAAAGIMLVGATMIVLSR
jgi:drug/metabolite transporter (DMT)-like permease